MTFKNDVAAFKSITLGNMEFSNPEELQKKMKREERFKNEYSTTLKDETTQIVLSKKQKKKFKNKATCQNLEKKYFRLSSVPPPSQLRPLPVLKKAFQHVKQRWIEEEDYSYVCEQLKSIRQDLTVLKIRNRFSVQVYEIHARIALEMKDLSEYNQCQTQLNELYSEGIPGNEMEFKAYHLLYVLSQSNHCNINLALASITNQERQHEAIAHAIEVVSTVNQSNYSRFMKLYQNSPNMNDYFLDYIAPSMRKAALKMIVKSFFPTYSVQVLQQQLLFQTKEECIEFLVNDGSVTLSSDYLTFKAETSS